MASFLYNSADSVDSSGVGSPSMSASGLPASSPPSPDAMLNRVFFIVDPTACKREEDPPEDMILYFYPAEVRGRTRSPCWPDRSVHLTIGLLAPARVVPCPTRLHWRRSFS